MTEELSNEMKQHRHTEYAIHPLIHNRWSPRSMTGEEMQDAELMPLFEAARWAPSSYNGQPWRFIYAKRNTPAWETLFSLMVAFNQSWAQHASALVVVISKTLFTHNQKPARTHSYDAGAAWMSLALEGTSRGYVVHGMEGFDYDKARQLLHIPDEYQIEAMIAIGKRAPKANLNPELQAMEQPGPRLPLTQILMQGTFVP